MNQINWKIESTDVNALIYHYGCTKQPSKIEIGFQFSELGLAKRFLKM